MIWTDESYISLFSGQERFARRPLNKRYGEKYVNQTPKHPVKVMIWGCFSAKGIGHIMVNSGSMNSEKYVATLSDKLLTSAEELYPEGNWIFQDDGAPCHRSKKTKDWVAENCPETLDWPGNSPDFSPIENLWAILKTKVRKHKPTTKESLISAIKKCGMKKYL